MAPAGPVCTGRRLPPQGPGWLPSQARRCAAPRDSHMVPAPPSPSLPGWLAGRSRCASCAGQEAAWSPAAAAEGGIGAAAQMAAQGSPGEAMDRRLQQAQRFKEDGNRCYKEGRFRDAVGRYHRALLQLRGLDPSVPSPLQAFGREQPPVTPEQERALHGTQTDCYNNLAACLLRMEPVNYERVKEYSLKVLERQPENPKALYRAGVAAYHLRDYDQARHYLMAATCSQPRDANVKRYLQLTESQLSTYHQKEKQLYMGMFS